MPKDPKDTFKNILPTTVLKGALEADLGRVFVVGKYKNGKLFAAGSHRTHLHASDIESFLNKLDDGEYDV